MKRTVCVIDDEFRSRKRVLNLLEGNESFTVVGEADNGKAAVELIDAINYVLKPYQDRRLLEALSRVPAGSHIGAETLHDLKLMTEEATQPKTYLKRISVKDKFEFRVINVEEIDFFHTEDNLVFLHTDGLHFIIDKSLSQLEESLHPDVFFRAHRKSLVNLNRIERVVPWGRGRYALRFTHDEKVHLSKDKTRELKALLGMH